MNDTDLPVGWEKKRDVLPGDTPIGLRIRHPDLPTSPRPSYDRRGSDIVPTLRKIRVWSSLITLIWYRYFQETVSLLPLPSQKSKQIPSCSFFACTIKSRWGSWRPWRATTLRRSYSVEGKIAWSNVTGTPRNVTSRPWESRTWQPCGNWWAESIFCSHIRYSNHSEKKKKDGLRTRTHGSTKVKKTSRHYPLPRVKVFGVHDGVGRVGGLITPYSAVTEEASETNDTHSLLINIKQQVTSQTSTNQLEL